MENEGIILHEYDRDELLRKALSPLMIKASEVHSLVHDAFHDLDEDDHTMINEKLVKAQEASFELHELLAQLDACSADHHYDSNGRLVKVTN